MCINGSAQRRLLAALAGIALAWTPVSGATLMDEPDPALRSYLSGNGLLNRGMYELAVSEYREFLAASPEHEKAPVARYGLAVALFKMKDYDGAGSELTRLRTLKDFQFEAEVLLLLAQCDMAGSRFDDAAASLEKLLAGHMEHESADDAAAMLGEARYRDGNYDAVAEACGLLATRWPDSPLRDRSELFWGLSDMGKKEYAAAAARLAALVERSPTSPFADQATLLVAQCHDRLDVREQAERYYAASIDRPGSKFVPDALLGMAGLRHRKGDLVGAGTALERLLTQYPDSSLVGAARLERGRVRFDSGQFDAAAEDFEQVLRQTKGGSDQGAYWLAKCDLRRNEPRGAAERLKNAISAYPKSDLLPEMTYDRAVALMRGGDSAGAEGVLVEFRTRFAKHALCADALELLASIEHLSARYDQSLAHCREFVEKYPEHELIPSVAFLTAENLFLSGDVEGGGAAYARFIKEYAGDANVDKAKFRLGTALFRLEKYDEATPLLLGAVDGRATQAAFRPALLCLGDIAFQRAQWPQAEGYLTDYLSFGPDVSGADDATLKLGLSLARQNRHDEALTQFDRIITDMRKSQHRMQAVFERGQCLMALNRHEEAAKAFETVVAEDKDARFAPYALSHLGAIALAAGDHAAAAKSFDRAAVANTDPKARGEAIFQKGQSLLGAEKYDAAAKVFSELLATMPDHRRAGLARAQRAIAMSRLARTEAVLAEIEAVQRDVGKQLEPTVQSALAYERAACLRDLGRFAYAGDAYRELLAGGEKGVLAVYAKLDLAAIESDAGSYDSAAVLLKEVRLAAANQKLRLPREVDEQALYRLGVCEFKMDRFKPGAVLFEEFLAAYDGSRLTASASLLCGECYFKDGRNDKAAVHLRHVADSFQSDEAYGPALLRLGEVLAAQQDWAGSERAFTTYLGALSKSELWFQAEFGVAWAKENQGKYEEAMAGYERVVNKHQGPTAARAQFQTGECLFALKQYDEAVRELLKVDILYAYPEWSAAALYEAGRCLNQLGRTEEARAQFELVKSKYDGTRWAQLAGEQLAAK